MCEGNLSCHRGKLSRIRELAAEKKKILSYADEVKRGEQDGQNYFCNRECR